MVRSLKKWNISRVGWSSKNMLLLTLDADAILNTTVELKDAVYTALDSAVGATIRR